MAVVAVAVTARTIRNPEPCRSPLKVAPAPVVMYRSSNLAVFNPTRRTVSYTVFVPPFFVSAPVLDTI